MSIGRMEAVIAVKGGIHAFEIKYLTRHKRQSLVIRPRSSQRCSAGVQVWAVQASQALPQ